LFFNTSLDLVGVKASTGLLIAIVLLFLDPHEVFLRDQDVRALFLLIVELLYELAIGFVEVFLLLGVNMTWFNTSSRSLIEVSALIIVVLRIYTTWGVWKVHTSLHGLRKHGLRSCSL
jgi:hypothetical protein